MSKQQSFSQYLVELGCPLHNRMWSWAGVSPDKARAVFTVWADHLHQGRYVLWDKADMPYKNTNGGRELRKIAQTAMDNRYESLGILQYAVDTNVSPRKRKSYDSETVFLLQLVHENDEIVAYVTGEIPSQDAIGGRVTHCVTPAAFAVDDIGAVPEGVEQPDRAWQVTSGYRRDSKVRAFVLARAKGRCELCDQEGFLTPSGKHYLEAHHIIGLADSGPDTVQNVIALCAEHHRQAHFGIDAEALEMAMLMKIAAKTSKHS